MAGSGAQPVIRNRTLRPAYVLDREQSFVLSIAGPIAEHIAASQTRRVPPAGVHIDAGLHDERAVHCVRWWGERR